MKCKLIEVDVLEAFGKTIEVPTGRESGPFEFSEFLDLYLSAKNLGAPEYRDELVKKLQDPKCFNPDYINNFLSRPYDSWYGNGNYNNWRIVKIWAPSLEQLVDDLTVSGRQCHEFLEQDVISEMKARLKREAKERNKAKQEAEKKDNANET